MLIFITIGRKTSVYIKTAWKNDGIFIDWDQRSHDQNEKHTSKLGKVEGWFIEFMQEKVCMQMVSAITWKGGAAGQPLC